MYELEEETIRRTEKVILGSWEVHSILVAQKIESGRATFD